MGLPLVDSHSNIGTRKPPSEKAYGGDTSPSCWSLLSPELRNDRDIALTAFVNEQISLEELPVQFHTDRSFFQGPRHTPYGTMFLVWPVAAGLDHSSHAGFFCDAAKNQNFVRVGAKFLACRRENWP